MRLPIIVFNTRNSKVLFFRSLTEAQTLITPSDVESYLYYVFDAEGYVYDPIVILQYGKFGPYYVVLEASGDQNIKGLRKLLLRSLNDKNTFGEHYDFKTLIQMLFQKIRNLKDVNTLGEHDDVETLIQMLIQKYGYTDIYMNAPIIVFCKDDSDLMFFKTLEDAQAYMEPPDIDFYQVYNVEGYVFQPKIVREGRFNNLVVGLEALGEQDLVGLRQVLLIDLQDVLLRNRLDVNTLGDYEDLKTIIQKLLEIYGYFS